MPKKGRLCGDRLWMLNMTVCEEGGVLMRLVGLSRSGCGKMSGGDGGNYVRLLDLMWVMGQKSVFGMMCGAGTRA
jgi:hypothetical protein